MPDQGILEQEAIGPTAGTPTGTPPAQPGQDDQSAEAVDLFIANGISMVHNKKLSDNFIKKILSATDPIPEIADATVMVVERLERAAEKNGIKITGDGVAQAGNIIMGEIIKMAELAGLDELSDDDKYQAFSMAVSKDLNRKVKSGKITPEQLAEMSKQVQQTPEGQKMQADFEQMMGGQGQPGGQAPPPAPPPPRPPAPPPPRQAPAPPTAPPMPPRQPAAQAPPVAAPPIPPGRRV